MGILLRIDVDNPYGYSDLLRKTFNFFALNYFFPPLPKLHLSNFKKLLEDLEDRGIPVNFFFKPKTLPSKELSVQIIKRNEVGLHAVQVHTFEKFEEELKKVNARFGNKVRGFSKHGHWRNWVGERGSVPGYNPNKLLKYARKAKLKYFAGNYENPTYKPEIVQGVHYFPSAFWLNERFRNKKFTLNWLFQNSQVRDIVVLMHPWEWVTLKQVREAYEKILTKTETFKKFSEVSDSFRTSPKL